MRLGSKQNKSENIRQTVFLEDIIELISKTPMEDRGLLLRKERETFF